MPSTANPSLAPSDSLTFREQRARAFRPPSRSSRASGRQSNATGSRHSSRSGQTASGTARLTERNLEVHNERKSFAEHMSARSGQQPSRAITAAKDEEIEVFEESSRRSSAKSGKAPPRTMAPPPEPSAAPSPSARPTQPSASKAPSGPPPAPSARQSARLSAKTPTAPPPEPSLGRQSSSASSSSRRSSGSRPSTKRTSIDSSSPPASEKRPRTTRIKIEVQRDDEQVSSRGVEIERTHQYPVPVEREISITGL